MTASGVARRVPARVRFLVSVFAFVPVEVLGLPHWLPRIANEFVDVLSDKNITFSFFVVIFNTFLIFFCHNIIEIKNEGGFLICIQKTKITE